MGLNELLLEAAALSELQQRKVAAILGAVVADAAGIKWCRGFIVSMIL